VARASQVELLIDYRDFLRTRQLLEWSANHPLVERLKELNKMPNPTYGTYKKGIEHSDPAICANVIIGLIKVTCVLLERQIEYLEQDFLKHGGIKERMTRARLASRSADPWKK
jgi:four helix bundle suffix protein